MYERILVALDGSELAEQVLPYVTELVRPFGSSIRLLRVSPLPTVLPPPGSVGLPPAVVPPPFDPAAGEAERQASAAYLAELGARLRAQGLTVTEEHPEGAAADVILERAREVGADLIAMTTHGRSGLSRFVFGSVAEAVVHQAPCPILLVRVRD